MTLRLSLMGRKIYHLLRYALKRIPVNGKMSQKSEFTCIYCGHVFSNKYRLKRHTETAVYCLDIQNKAEDIKFFTCECQASYTLKSSLLIHQKKCQKRDIIIEQRMKITRLEEAVKYLTEENERLRDQIAEKERNQQVVTLTAVSRPTTSVRNNIKNAIFQTLEPLKESEMSEHAPFLTIDHIKEGAEGYAKFAMSRPFKDRITCTDVARKKLAWKNDIGEIVYDTEGNVLSEKFFKVIKERNEQLCKEIIIDLGERLSNAYKRDDQEEADTIIELTDKIQTWRREAYQASKGTSNDLKVDFARALCKISCKND